MAKDEKKSLEDLMAAAADAGAVVEAANKRGQKPAGAAKAKTPAKAKIPAKAKKQSAAQNTQDAKFSSVEDKPGPTTPPRRTALPGGWKSLRPLSHFPDAQRHDRLRWGFDGAWMWLIEGEDSDHPEAKQLASWHVAALADGLHELLRKADMRAANPAQLLGAVQEKIAKKLDNQQRKLDQQAQTKMALVRIDLGEAHLLTLGDFNVHLTTGETAGAVDTPSAERVTAEPVAAGDAQLLQIGRGNRLLIGSSRVSYIPELITRELAAVEQQWFTNLRTRNEADADCPAALLVIKT